MFILILILIRKNSAFATEALRKTVFAEIFIFASFGNLLFLKIRVGTSFSSFYRTLLDLRKLVPTLIFAKNCENSQNSQKNREKTRFFAKIRVGEVGKYEKIINKNNKKMMFNSSRLDSRKLVPTRKPTRNFEFKFGMQGLICHSRNHKQYIKINAYVNSDFTLRMKKVSNKF